MSPSESILLYDVSNTFPLDKNTDLDLRFQFFMTKYYQALADFVHNL